MYIFRGIVSFQNRTFLSYTQNDVISCSLPIPVPCTLGLHVQTVPASKGMSQPCWKIQTTYSGSTNHVAAATTSRSIVRWPRHKEHASTSWDLCVTTNPSQYVVRTKTKVAKNKKGTAEQRLAGRDGAITGTGNSTT